MERVALQKPVFHIDRVLTIGHDDSLFELSSFDHATPNRSVPFPAEFAEHL